jgi:hypothetical protein
MLWASVRGEMTTVLLVIIGLIVAGLFSRVMRVLATVCTLGFAAFAALLVWQPGKVGTETPPLKPAAFRCPEGAWARNPIVETPSQLPYIEWAKKHCPGPIFTIPDKTAKWK